MTSNANLQQRRVAAVPRGVGNAYQIFAESAKNAEITDVEGRRLIDFAGGIAVMNTGHGHPKIVAAVKEQLDRFSHTCFQVTPYESYIRLAERLNKLAPGSSPKKTIFLTTGAEAVENAVKIARAHTKRSGVIAFSGAFHGRTMLGMALTGKVVPYKVGFGPFPGEIYHVPFPDPALKDDGAQSLKILETMFKADISPDNVAAIIIEPVQGEGGFNIVPFAFMKSLRELCTKHGICLIVDEIQTGFARTGKMFAHEHSGIEADMITVAKSLAGGFPLSGVIGKAEIMDAPAAGGLGGTYGGSPIGCAAANAVLDVMEEEKLVERSNHIGKLMLDRLADMKKKNSFGNRIGDIRGLGAMVACDLVKADGSPDADLTKAVVAKAGENGLILLSCGVNANVLRFLMPLTAEDKLINEGFDVLEKTIGQAIEASAKVA
ncbi:4-aminobutyrate aminotransferase/(S)-3-amino-2-methylpropionate transaminase [Dongia mobilis]|uniref:4-aminobutyrate aminotransferase/(S)-3-amino-2-methylpropionate transaminase n=1 Tax=Dongia mobilis TaxID=578943 RepID=A0A4V3DEZ2_9PROT|nr:4-aminobutyrate--2-oxoglutarate transaminase [Dongia mobilis]TDQ84051.1 4-aminobutyrate aminotransferase/(S)-3-amino-2-methylpropionate transaminase [Dongia mobilis]